MEAIVLAATYERKTNSAGQIIPLPLVDVEYGTPHLTTLVRSAARIPGVRKVVVVTNELAKPSLDRWAGELADVAPRVQVISDRTSSPTERLGAMGDLVLGIEAGAIDDDLLIMGGDNWFDFSLSDFIQHSNKRSPAVILVRHQGASRQSRFGMVKTDAAERITRFEEKPSGTDLDLGASCIYYFARHDLRWFSAFAKEQSTHCSPGVFLQWLLKRTVVYGMVINGHFYDLGMPSNEVELLSISEALKSTSQDRFASWERAALRQLDMAVRTREDLLNTSRDGDVNRRIVATFLMGELGQDWDADARRFLEAVLIGLLCDGSQNQIGSGSRQAEEESEAYVSASAAEALVQLGYAPTVSAVFERAKAEGHSVLEKQNVSY